MNNKNNKSDLMAKESFVKELIKRGYQDVHVIAAPADIEATINGQKQYFEIKKTSKNDKYFGAATFTEWFQAYKDPENYCFVIAIEKDDGSFSFIEKTPMEFEKYCSIPPLKVYFNIELEELNNESKKRKNQKSKTVKLTQSSFNKLYEVYNDIKNNT